MSNQNRRTGRAWRRHDRARVSRQRKRRQPYYFDGRTGDDYARVLGIATNTAVLCSCWMCGNPRRHRPSEITLAERRAADSCADGWLEFLDGSTPLTPLGGDDSPN